MSTLVNLAEFLVLRSHNPKVVGSNPTPATNKINELKMTRWVLRVFRGIV
jgi:hypothetical protein